MNGLALAPSLPSGLSTDVASLHEDLARLLRDSVPENTRRAYQGAWSRFEAWCTATLRESMPAEPTTVALYVAALERRSVATIRQALAAIALAHGLKKHPNPCDDVLVRGALKGIKKGKPNGAAGTPKKALVADSLRAAMGDAEGLVSFREARRQAVLVIGFFAALRRSELVALRWRDVEESTKGLLVTVRRSKTDQSGRGHVVALLFQSDGSMCPVRVLARWRTRLAPRSLDEFVFPSIRGARVRRSIPMSESSVVDIVKNGAARAGLLPENFAAHSLRSGFATTAAEAGKRPEAIQAQLRHRSPAMVLRYVQRADLWKNNATSGLGG